MMGEILLGAIDQGTTSTRFIVFDSRGAIRALAQKEHRQYTPAPGLVEHDAAEILANTLEVAALALTRAGLTAADLTAVGLTNQRETTLIWERASGRPLGRAIVWQDTRTAPAAARLAAGPEGEEIRRRTGLPPTSYFSALKLAALLDADPAHRARAARGEILFGTIDSWLAWNLTGGAAGGRHVTDVTNASRTQLMALTGETWDEGLLALFGIPRAMLPEIVPSNADLGPIRLGVLAGARLSGLIGDQQAALLGQGCILPGLAKATHGTGTFLLLNTGETPVFSRHGLLTTLAYRLADGRRAYALEGAIAVSGALVQWLRDQLGLIGAAPEIEALAASVPDAAGVVIVPAFSGLYAPHWNERARGAVFGLTRAAGRAHLARAALEAVAHQLADVLGAMLAEEGVGLAELRCDGGMSANDLFMQISADLLGVPVHRPALLETTAWGAALAAGLGAGVWRNAEEAAGALPIARSFTPAMAPEARAEARARWQKAIARSLDWLDA
jgi:glycerol kinase